MTLTPESIAALDDLRRGGHFDWYIVNALAFVLYVYASAIRRGEWDRVALSIGFFAVELIWEMFNAMVLRCSGHAALWMVAGHSAYLIYVGLNLEIALMFAVAPLVLFQLMPDDRTRRARWLVPVALGLFCVLVETLLNRVGVLVWTWPFWRWPNLPLVICAYCAPFVALIALHERLGLRAKIVGALGAVVLAIALHLVFASYLRWI